MNHTFRILEFNIILEKLEEYACTEAGKQAARMLTPYLYEGDVRRNLRDTTEARTMIDCVGLPPAVGMKGLAEILKTAEQGGCLSAEELEVTAQILAGVRRLRDFLNRCKYLELSLPYYEENLDPMEDLRHILEESVRAGRVEDSASKKLEAFVRTVPVWRRKSD